MSNRDVTVRLRAEVGAYKAAMKEAEQATKSLSSTGDSAFARLSRAQAEHEQAWNTLSKTALVAGGSMVATVGAVTKAAIGWESAWAGVKKTTDGTPEQMAALESELRGLAKTLPATHEEIAGVAEAAGQLGIKRENVADFTKTMIDMGESTNLSADEAATSIARFTNIMGSMSKHGESAYSRIGSAMVALGNNFATTESEINSMSLRLAGAGSQIGMTESDVLALAAAMSSVGIEAEAGGTAMSTVMKKIDKAVREGGDSVEGFAQVAGMSAQEFVKAWGENPARAMEAFNTGLGKVKESGGSVAQTLTDLGIKGTREQDTMMRLAGASELLGDALETSNQAFEENSALADEASQRYETAESRIKIAWNNIKDSAITAGGAILPVVADMADAIAGFADFIGSLPGPVLGAMTAITGIGGAALLTVGGVMKATTAVADFRAATDALGISLPSTDGKMGKLAKTAGVVAVTFTALQIAASLAESGLEKLGDASEYATALKVLDTDAEAGIRRLNELSTASGSAGTSVNGLGNALETVNMNGFMKGLDWVGSGFGAFDSDLSLAETSLRNFDTALSTTASTSLEQAAKGFQEFKKQAEASGMTLDQAAAAVPGYANALRDLAAEHNIVLEGEELYQAMLGDLPPKLQEAMTAAEGAGGAMAGMGDDMGALGAVAGETASTFDDLVDALTSMGILYVSQEEAVGQYYESVEGLQAQVRGLIEAQIPLADVFDASTGKFNKTTEAGRKTSQAFFKLRQDGLDAAAAMAKSGESTDVLTGQLVGTYQQLYDNAIQLGLTSEQADQLTRSTLAIPDDVSIETYMSGWARDIANQTDGAVRSIPDGVKVGAFMGSQAKDMAWATKSAIDAIPTWKTVTVKVAVSGAAAAGALAGAMGGRWTGGYASPMRGFARGGLLPGTPPANPFLDNLPGLVADTGEPVMLRSREYIVNEPGTHRGQNLSWLRWMNEGGTMQTPAPRGFSAGGLMAHAGAQAAPPPVAYANDPAVLRAALEGTQLKINMLGRDFKAIIAETQRTYGRG